MSPGASKFGTRGVSERRHRRYDGPTDAAGGVVDGMTVVRGAASGMDHRAFLAENDSYRYLERTDGLGRPTGTNVMDIHILIVGEPEHNGA